MLRENVCVLCKFVSRLRKLSSVDKGCAEVAPCKL